MVMDVVMTGLDRTGRWITAASEFVGRGLAISLGTLWGILSAVLRRIGLWVLDLPFVDRLARHVDIRRDIAVTPPASHAAVGDGMSTAKRAVDEAEPLPHRARYQIVGVGVTWVLMTLAWGLMTMMNRLDSALQQMGATAGGILGFPVDLASVPAIADEAGNPMPGQTAVERTVTTTVSAWRDFVTATRPSGAQPAPGAKLGCVDGAILNCPSDIAAHILRLDAAFIVVYVAAIVLCIVSLWKVNLRRPGWSALGRRQAALQGAFGGLAALAVVDIAEDALLWQSYVSGAWITDPASPVQLLTVAGVPVGPVLSALKLALSASVLVTVALVAGSLALGRRPCRRALVSSRGVLYAVGGLFLLLLVGIGADQVDDVVRAWDAGRGLISAFAALGLGAAVAGVMRDLSSSALDAPLPDRGRSPQSLIVGAGALLAIVGFAVTPRIGLGWGLGIAGLLLVAVWIGGLPFEGAEPWPSDVVVPWWVKVFSAVLGGVLGWATAGLLDLGRYPTAFVGVVLGLAVPAWVAVVRSDRSVQTTSTEEEMAQRSAAATTPVAGRTPTGRSDHDWDEVLLDRAQAREIAIWGDRVGRAAGSAVCALVVAVTARAIALDVFADRTKEESLLGPALAIVVAIVCGTGLITYRAGVVGSKVPRWRAWWVAATIVSVLILGALAFDQWAVTGAQLLGTVGLVFVGVAAVLGIHNIAASISRQGPVSSYRLAPLFRAMRLRRFPVVVFLVAWIAVVGKLDQGGFHDVRRGLTIPDTVASPSIGQALDGYLAATPVQAGGTRPVVLVGASGGGIRAAVWTALVMECLFGPGSVSGTNAGVCAHDDSSGATSLNSLSTEAKKPLSVFLASGASGGSVGLAAWSARRTDLLDNATETNMPGTAKEMLTGDLVAPLMGRLLISDLPHMFLANASADRAQLLERAWESAYAASTQAKNVEPGRGLARGMRDLWNASHAAGSWSTPILAMNAIEVEDDCRFVVSAVDFRLPRGINGTDTGDAPDDGGCRGTPDPRSAVTGDAPVMPSTNELIDYLCPTEDLPLSAAAHISARFPYVSPTGRIARTACATDPATPGLVPPGSLSYVADGGLFDNSAAGTVVDTWRALSPFAIRKAAGQCLVPLYVQIDNSPPASTVADPGSPDRRPYEMLAPLMMTLGQVASREEYSRSRSEVAFSQPVAADGRRVTMDGVQPTSLWFRITLTGQPGPEPPLGWTLAPATVEDMRAQLNNSSNASQIQQIRKMVAGGLRCVR